MLWRSLTAIAQSLRRYRSGRAMPRFLSTCFYCASDFVLIRVFRIFRGSLLYELLKPIHELHEQHELHETS